MAAVASNVVWAFGFALPFSLVAWGYWLIYQGWPLDRPSQPWWLRLVIRLRTALRARTTRLDAPTSGTLGSGTYLGFIAFANCISLAVVILAPFGWFHSITLAEGTVCWLANVAMLTIQARLVLPVWRQLRGQNQRNPSP